MAKSRADTIVLTGDPIYKEGVTDEALSPGHVLENGGTADIQKNTVANRNAGLLIAKEATDIGCGIEDAYAANDRVRYFGATKGMVVLVRVAAGATAITANALLATTNSGTVAGGATDDTACGIALEALDNSSGTTEAFIRMEVA